MCTIGITAEDEDNERKRGNKKKQCIEFTTHAIFTSSIIHWDPGTLCGFDATRLPKPCS